MHIENNNPEFLEMLTEKGLNAKMIMQPANSPDMKLLDLWLFQAVQSANDKVSEGEAQISEHVNNTFVEYPRHKIN